MSYDLDSKSLLLDGIDQLQLEIRADIIDDLLHYINLLLKWNNIYSLTAIIKIDEVIKHHLLDGLTLIKYIEECELVKPGSCIIDIGSGMGVPGIILAIYYKNNKIEVLDSNNKKTSFLRQVGIELGLQNLVVTTSRVEEYSPRHKYDIITSRAFAEMKLFVSLSEHLLNSNGCFLAMKGSKAVDESKFLDGYSVDIARLVIPGVTKDRFLVKIER